MTTTNRTAATTDDIDASNLFYAIDGNTCNPLGDHLVEIVTGKVVSSGAVMLNELEIVDLAMVCGELRQGRFLQISDITNPVPKTIFEYPAE